MNCINTSHPQYKKLLKLAEAVNKNNLDLYLDVSRFNNYFKKFPDSLEELDKGVDFIKTGDLLSEQIADMVMLDTPAITRAKANRYEFKVVEDSDKLTTRGKNYETAKRLVTEINNKYVNKGSPNIARVTDESGIVTLIIEPTLQVIENYRENLNKQGEISRLEYEEETRVSEDMYERSDYDGIQDFEKLIELKEISQFCSR